LSLVAVVVAVVAVEVEVEVEVVVAVARPMLISIRPFSHGSVFPPFA
jgi:hypothetical protein